MLQVPCWPWFDSKYLSFSAEGSVLLAAVSDWFVTGYLHRFVALLAVVDDCGADGPPKRKESRLAVANDS